MKKNNAFTLIELMIVITLIALTLSVVGSFVPRCLKKDKIEAQVARFAGLIELAETIMCTNHIDVNVTCNQTKTGVECHLCSSKGIRKITLKHLNVLKFNQCESPVVLHFNATLSQPPIGEIEIGIQHYRRFISLPGYPGGTKIHQRSQSIGGGHDETSYPQEILSVA